MASKSRLGRNVLNHFRGCLNSYQTIESQEVLYAHLWSDGMK